MLYLPAISLLSIRFQIMNPDNFNFHVKLKINQTKIYTSNSSTTKETCDERCIHTSTRLPCLLPLPIQKSKGSVDFLFLFSFVFEIFHSNFFSFFFFTQLSPSYFYFWDILKNENNNEMTLESSTFYFWWFWHPQDYIHQSSVYRKAKKILNYQNPVHQ